MCSGALGTVEISLGTLLGCIERRWEIRALGHLSFHWVYILEIHKNFHLKGRLLLKKEKVESHWLIGISLSEGKKHSSSFGEMKPHFFSLSLKKKKDISSIPKKKKYKYPYNYDLDLTNINILPHIFYMKKIWLTQVRPFCALPKLPFFHTSPGITLILKMIDIKLHIRCTFCYKMHGPITYLYIVCAS